MTLIVPARSRRFFLSALAAGGGGLLYRARRVRRAARADAAADRGAVLPDKLPLDTDNDLIIINDGHHAGRRRDHAPDRPGPRRQRQADPQRRSSRSGSATATASTCTRGDSNRDGSATATSRASAASSPARPASTTSAPSSRCRTPAARRTSTSRSSAGGTELLTTQCYVKGDPATSATASARHPRPERPARRVIVDFAPLRSSKIGELAARFDIVLGVTPGREIASTSVLSRVRAVSTGRQTSVSVRVERPHQPGARPRPRRAQPCCGGDAAGASRRGPRPSRAPALPSRAQDNLPPLGSGRAGIIGALHHDAVGHESAQPVCVEVDHRVVDVEHRHRADAGTARAGHDRPWPGSWEAP